VPCFEVDQGVFNSRNGLLGDTPVCLPCTGIELGRDPLVREYMFADDPLQQSLDDLREARTAVGFVVFGNSRCTILCYQPQK